MRYLKYFLLLAAVLALPTVHSQAQVAIGVQIGPTYGVYNAPPVCEYGFYPDYPFDCAPYGYWGPNYFVNGVFIGVGPWNNFYFTHPTYYRPFYVNRGFGFRPGFEHFRSAERFGPRETFRGGPVDRGFRSFNEPRFDGNRGFDRGRGFNEARGFRGDDRGFRGGNHDYRMSGRGPSNSGGHEYRGPEGRGGSQYSGGSSHNGGGSHSGGSHNGGSNYHGGGESHGGNHGGRR